MAAKTHTYKTWDHKVSSDDPDAKERGIRQDGVRDWRDPDRVLVLDGARVRSRDTAVEGHEQGAANEPNWAEYDTYLMWNDTMKTENLGRNPPSIFKEAWKNGLVLYGVIIARDEQRHN